MGKALKEVTANTDMAKESEEKALEKGAEAVSEAQEAKSIYEGIRGCDVEEEVIDAAEAGIEGVKDDAGQYMKDDAHELIDEAGEKVEEVSDQSQEQIELNDQASEDMDSIENYGKEQAEQAKETTKELSETFENHTESAEEDLEETEEEHEQQLEEIEG